MTSLLHSYYYYNMRHMHCNDENVLHFNVKRENKQDHSTTALLCRFTKLRNKFTVWNNLFVIIVCKIILLYGLVINLHEIFLWARFQMQLFIKYFKGKSKEPMSIGISTLWLPTWNKSQHTYISPGSIFILSTNLNIILLSVIGFRKPFNDNYVLSYGLICINCYIKIVY